MKSMFVMMVLVFSSIGVFAQKDNIPIIQPQPCLDCRLFPVCEGGCNRHRIDNRESGTNYNLCPFDEDGFCDSLYEFYKSKHHEA